MALEIQTAIGLIAATLTTVAFVPQVVRTLRTRDTRSISTGMYATFVSGVGLWLLYGILLRDPPIILANAVTFVLALTVLLLKLKYG